MTLSRVLEPEVMESLDEALDYDRMNHDQVNRSFVDDLLARGEIGQDVLDLGTGTARIPILLCQTREDVRVTAVDLSIHMLDVARNNVELAGLVDRIRLDRIDSKTIPIGNGEFDAVISNSLVHHLADPLPAIREAVRVVKTGGVLFFRDLMRPATEELVSEFVQRYAAGECEHACQMFGDSLRAALTLDEIRDLVVSVGFDEDTCQATSDRHWTWSATR